MAAGAWLIVHSQVLTYIPTIRYVQIMPRQTIKDPERGEARTRLLDAARDVIRQKGFTATTVNDLCEAAGVTKGAFFHHFDSKEALGIAAAQYWSETTSQLFASAPYHAHDNPLDRLLAYVDFRESIIKGDIAQFTCLAGTMTQETFDSHPAVRDACASSIFDHAETLVPDIEAAMQQHGLVDTGWSARSLACHTQAVLQGAFILAKATGDSTTARENIGHLRRYIALLFGRCTGESGASASSAASDASRAE
jgi:TetR/AcrR family transcriptional repressor of nem operon